MDTSQILDVVNAIPHSNEDGVSISVSYQNGEPEWIYVYRTYHALEKKKAETEIRRIGELVIVVTKLYITDKKEGD